MGFSLRHQVVVSLVVALLVAFTSGQAVGRKWTGRGGQTTEADFLRVKAGTVYLRRSSGRPRIVKLPLNQLSDVDQQYVRSIRTWTDRSGKFSIKAVLLKTSDGKVTLERLDGTKTEIEISILSEADRKYVTSNLRFVFAELDSKESSEKPDHIADLIAFYEDEEGIKSTVRRLKALEDLGRFGPQAAGALPFLRKLLLKNDKNDKNELKVRKILFSVLAKIGKPSVPTLIGMLEVLKDPINFATDPHRIDPNSCLACLAIESLGNIGEDAKDATSILIELSIQSKTSFADPRSRFGIWNSANGIPNSADASSFSKIAFEVLGRVNSDSDAVTPGLIKILETNVRRYGPFKNVGEGFEFNQTKYYLASECSKVLVRLDRIGSAPKELVPLAKELMEMFSGGARQGNRIKMRMTRKTGLTSRLPRLA